MNITHPVPSAQADLTVVLALARLLVASNNSRVR